MKHAICARRFRARARLGNGSQIIELPMVLYVFFIGLIFPLIALALIAVRAALLNTVAAEAASAAAKALTFEVGTADNPPALTLAEETAIGAAARFGGITVVPADVTTQIVITELNEDGSFGQIVRNPPGQALEDAADSSKNIYQIEVVVNGLVEPIVKMSFSGPMSGLSVPGLTSSFRQLAVGREFCENAQGLNR